MHDGTWRTTSAGSTSPFGTSCKTFDFCGAEQNSLGQTTYKIACSECADGYLPAEPVFSAQRDLISCDDEYYPSSCYLPVPIESDFQQCPEADNQDVECKYWKEGEWIQRNQRQYTPWATECAEFKMCHSDIESSLEVDEYVRLETNQLTNKHTN